MKRLLSNPVFFPTLLLLSVLTPPVAVNAEAPLAIRGTVLRADGSGLVGAQVELAPLPASFETETALLTGRKPGMPLATATTDAAGRFALEAPGPGVWQVRAKASGHVTMRYPILPLANGVGLPPVTLRPAVRATITVVDAEQVPIAGAGVLAVSADGTVWAQPESPGWKPALRVGWTDAAGQLHLVRARGERLDVWAHLVGQTGTASAEAARDATLSLQPTRAVAAALTIREPGGTPAADVTASFPETAWPLGRSGADGTLRLHGHLAAPLALRLASADGRSVDITLMPGEAPGAVVLPPAASFAGRVRGRDGTPLAGALVWAGHDPGGFSRSDANGRYTLAAGAREPIRVQAHAPGFVARGVAFRRADIGAEIDLVLPPALAVHGRVVDGAGAAVAGAQLAAVVQEVRPPMIRLDAADARSETDQDGRFALAGLTPGHAYTVTTSGAGFGATTRTIDLPVSGPAEAVEIILAAGRLVVGRVVDLEERPLAGITVQLRAADNAVEEEEGAHTATSDADGRFALHGLPAQTLDILARGAAVAPLTVRGVQVPPGNAPVDLGTLLLGPGAALAGRVVEPTGIAVAGAEVWVVETAAQARRLRLERVEGEADVTADERGRFVAEGLEPGREIGLYVDGPGFLPAVMWGMTPPLRTPLEVALLPAARIHGEVVDEAGTPIAGAEISLHAAPVDDPAAAAEAAPENLMTSYTATSDAEGGFIVEDVAVGAFQIEAYAAGFVPAPPQAVDVAEPLDVAGPRFVLVRGAVLSGRVMNADLEPVAGARVRLGRPQAESDDQGRYQVAGVAPGPQGVEVYHPGFNRVYEALEIEPGVTTADFILEGGHRVAGYVVDSTSLPVPDVTVELVPTDDDGLGETYETTSDSEGAFHLDQVANGGYRLRPNREGYAEAGPAEAVEVAGGPLEGLEVRVERGARIEGQILGLDFEQLALVEVRAEAEERSLLGEVDYEGGYQISDLAVDDWTVTAYLPGGRREARARVSIESGAGVVNRDLEFGDGFALEGWVRYGGEPLSDANIQLRGHDVPVKRVVTTDLEGRFGVEDLAAGSYRISLMHAEERLFHNEDLTVTDDREVVIDIDTARLAGVVVDAASGEAVADALVVLQQEIAAGKQGSQVTVSTDGDGRFAANRLSAGRYGLRVMHDNYQPAERDVEVVAGSVVEGLRVPLDPAAGLEVAVELLSGQPPQYITLWGRDGQGRTFAETRPTYAEGLTVFPTLPAGDWSLLVGATGGAIVESQVAVPSETLTVVMPPAGRLRVRVPALVESDSVATLTVRAQDGQPFRHLAWGGQLEQSWQVVGGRATVEGIPAGQWQLQVQGPRGEIFAGVAATTGGPDIEIELQ